MLITFYGMDIDKEGKEIINKIISFIQKDESREYKTSIVDVKSIDPERIDYPAIIFGQVAKRLIEIDESLPHWTLPPLESLLTNKENKESRERAFEELKEIKEFIKKYSLEDHLDAEDQLAEEQDYSYVEKDSVKFGDFGDINITEREAEHLKKIKDILGGGKIVIRKGDLVLEVGE